MRLSQLLGVLVVLAPCGFAWGEYDVKAYGATGNGTTDDTSAIQSAINAAGPNRGTVYFPEGQYKVTSTLNLSYQYVTLRGAGGQTQQSRINFTPGSAVNLFSVTQPNTRIMDLRLDQMNSTAGSLVFNTGGDELVVEGCTLLGHPNNTNVLLYTRRSLGQFNRNVFLPYNIYAFAIRVQKTASSLNIEHKITDNIFKTPNPAGGGGKGIIIDKDYAGTSGQPEGVIISRNTFMLASGENIHVQAGVHISISDNVLDQNSYYNVWLDAALGSIDSISIANNWFNTTTSNGSEVAIFAAGSGGRTVSSVNILGNRINLGYYGVALGSAVTKVNISNNFMSGNGAAGAVGVSCAVGGTPEFNVIGNNISGYPGADILDTGTSVNKAYNF